MISTRPAIAADRPFIVSGWSTSYKPSRDCTTPASLYPKHKHEEITFYLDRCATLVAHGDSGVLFGFIAFDPTSYVALRGERRIEFAGYVLYVYVAGPFRRRGIARRLFAAAGVDPLRRFGFLCRTRSSWELRSKTPLAEHEPNRARYEEIEHGHRSIEGDHEARTAEAPAGPDPDQQDLAQQDD